MKKRKGYFEKEEKDAKLGMAKSLIWSFIYHWADAKYNEQSTYELVKTWIKKINPNSKKITKKVWKLEEVFSGATYNFDLPEHPEKHNGYFESWKYQDEVARIFGYNNLFKNYGK